MKKFQLKIILLLFCCQCTTKIQYKQLRIDPWISDIQVEIHDAGRIEISTNRNLVIYFALIPGNLNGNSTTKEMLALPVNSRGTTRAIISEELFATPNLPKTLTRDDSGLSADLIVEPPETEFARIIVDCIDKSNPEKYRKFGTGFFTNGLHQIPVYVDRPSRIIKTHKEPGFEGRKITFSFPEAGFYIIEYDEQTRTAKVQLKKSDHIVLKVAKP